MKELQNINNIYFLGIGGIGMSALARFFHLNGKFTAGYDRTMTDLTRQLVVEGIPIHYEDSIDSIPSEFKSPDRTWVILTPAVPADNVELNFFRLNGFKIFKRSEILGKITSEYKTAAVAGTHGKTTVSTMAAYIMSKSTFGCNAFLGGISKNFDSNLVINLESSWVVTEADEFDRSFLQLHPFAAIVTAMDPDHLDIYGTAMSMKESFNKFIGQINKDGILVIKKGLPYDSTAIPKNTYTYSLTGESDFYASNLRLENGKYYFDLNGPDILIKDLSLLHPGLVNVENAVAACALSSLLNIDANTIKSSLQTFSGIKRRFDYQIKTDRLVYIDDYAHHPQEIEATLKSLRNLYPDRKITGIFQPHLYSRTRDFAQGFSDSLSLLDRLILLDIYPARELPIEGVTSDIIFNNVELEDKILCSKNELLDIINKIDIDVLISLGAGDIDKFVDPIKQILTKRI